MSWAAGFPLAPAFGEDLDLAADLRGLLARDVSLAFGFEAGYASTELDFGDFISFYFLPLASDEDHVHPQVKVGRPIFEWNPGRDFIQPFSAADFIGEISKQCCIYFLSNADGWISFSVRAK